MLDKIYFQYIILKRIMKLVRRKSRNIKLLYFNHTTIPSNEKQLVVKYKFSNALYFKVNGKKTTATALTLQKPLDEENLPLTVYGFFRRAEFTITVRQDDIFLTRVSALKVHKQLPGSLSGSTIKDTDSVHDSQEYNVA